jgi:hypothetical protein
MKHLSSITIYILNKTNDIGNVEYYIIDLHEIWTKRILKLKIILDSE